MKKKANSGFTLAEVLLTLAVYSIVMLSVPGVLIPAFKRASEYDVKNADNIYLTYLQEALTNKIGFDAVSIRVSEDTAEATHTHLAGNCHEFIQLDAENDMSNNVFSHRRAKDGAYAGSDIRPGPGTRLRMDIKPIGKENVKAVVITLILSKGEETAGRTEFTVPMNNVKTAEFLTDIEYPSVFICYEDEDR